VVTAQYQDRRVAGYGIGSGAPRQQISAFLSIKCWSTGAIFGYLSDCAAASGTRKQMLIASTIIVLPRAMILIILSVIILSLVGALIARNPFAAAARSP